MKGLIYILFLLIGLEQTPFAQKIDTLRTERLELRLEPDLIGFIPCEKEWFQAQKDTWKLEIDKDVRNEKAWENHYLTCEGIRDEGTLLWKKKQPRLLKEVKKYIPDTRVCYKVLDDEVMVSDKGKGEAIKEKIAYLRRDCERDYRDSM